VFFGEHWLEDCVRRTDHAYHYREDLVHQRRPGPLYLCNNLTEVDAWKSAGGRPFDFIIVGGGTFGSAIAEHLWFRQKQAGGGLRTLVVEAGLFTVPEHVQNTGIQGFTDPQNPFF
jgi:Dehydrogenases (flavoproteins)